MYICSICKTPTPRENHCDTCGWVQTILIKEEKKVIQTPKLENKVEDDGYLLVTKI